MRTGWRGPSVASDAKTVLVSQGRWSTTDRAQFARPPSAISTRMRLDQSRMLKVGEVSTAVALREIGPYLVCLGTPPFAQSAPLVTHHGERDLGWANGGVPGFSAGTTERLLIHVPTRRPHPADAVDLALARILTGCRQSVRRRRGVLDRLHVLSRSPAQRMPERRKARAISRRTDQRER